MEHDRPGRNWRALGDTATALPGYSNAPRQWASERRPGDYYDEMLLVWLEVDTILRRETNGVRSIDDFCRAFFAGNGPFDEVRPYTRQSIVAALTRIAPFDWNAFLQARIDRVNVHAPLEGIKNAGWQVTYGDVPNEFISEREHVEEAGDLSYSLGVWIKTDGVIVDVVPRSPGFEAGLIPGVRIVAIGDSKWSLEAAIREIRSAQRSAVPIRLVTEFSGVVRIVDLNYHDGLRYPQLLRDNTKIDLLAAILAPRAKSTP
jgi:predicted metalloprotease with PDZ domain